jgi:hypothetical protein
MLFHRNRDNIARSARIKDRLLKTILSWIQRERTGEVINRGLLKNITQMLVDLGVNSRTVYEDDFERHFLETSATFYRVESQEFIASNSASDYMRKVPCSCATALLCPPPRYKSFLARRLCAHPSWLVGV